MKKLSVFLLAGLLLAGTVFGGVVKKTKSEITFQKFGTYTTLQEEKLTAERRAADSENTFKGKGIVSNLAGKALLRSGKFGEIIDLTRMTVTSLDHKRKQYQVDEIKPLSQQAGQKGQSDRPTQQDKPAESDIKVIRNEFKVEKTGDSREINQFSCNKYLISWLSDWENTKTGEKGSERLSTEVWTTTLTSDLKAGQQEQTAFFREYMKKLEMDTDVAADDYLGLSWMRILSSMDPTGSKPRISTAKAASELKKIQGFPVVVDGKYHSQSEGGEKAQDEEEGGGGILGKLGKKLLKKESKDEGDAPILAYYTEIMEISKADLSPEDFQVPAGYKEKK